MYIISRIKAIIASITLFIVGIVYAGQPIEVDFNTQIKYGEEYIELKEDMEPIIFAPNETQQEISSHIRVDCTNIGKPFKGERREFIRIYIYRIENGEKKYIKYDYSDVYIPEEIRPELIRKNETLTDGVSITFRPSIPNGIYSIRVEAFDNEITYENVFIVK